MSRQPSRRLTPAQRNLLAEVLTANAHGSAHLVTDRRRYRTVLALREAGAIEAEYEPVMSAAGRSDWHSAYRCDLVLTPRERRRVRVGKSGGDDAYSYALRLDGRMLRSGEDRRSAAYYRKRLLRQIAAGVL